VNRRQSAIQDTAHIYQIYIAAAPEQVWSAITESEWRKRYSHATEFVEPPRPGQPYRTIVANGQPAVDGMIEEMQPPTGRVPGRFVQTWHTLYDRDLEREPPSRVEWTVEWAGDGLTRVRLIHSNLEHSPLTWENVRDGWVWILDNMKTLLETGRTLPRVSEEDDLARAETA
jgi:uncharacterized protein YndB with AHSA1/START domain